MIVLNVIILSTVLVRCSVAFPYNFASDPFNDKTSNTTINDLNLAQHNFTNLEAGHPVYPVTCLVRPNEAKVPAAVRKALIMNCRHILYEFLAQVKYVSEDLEFRDQLYSNPSGKVLPAVWTRGLCTIYVKSHFTDDTTWMSIMDVVSAAVRILNNCVEEGTQLAGSSMVGSPVKSFYVMLIARIENAGIDVGSSNSSLSLEESKRSLDAVSLEPGL